MFKSIALACCIATAAAHSPEEIRNKGLEIKEAKRMEIGHWLKVSPGSNMIDVMTDHIGNDGIAVAGFFLTKLKEDGKRVPYTDIHPGDWEHEEDKLFAEYQRLAINQRWLVPAGLPNKQWTFAYSHDKAAGDKYGCHGVANKAWEHICLVVFKTSKDGSNQHTFTTTHFGLDTTRGHLPTVKNIKPWLLEKASVIVAGGHGGEL